ncbi:MAG: hypothetical protein JO252_14945 [Planctomycetaceae bacterium]|nr:hypothetical protein [Planctomycetaceae bacterium]MBV8316067.1 hypothetical protein [Planctomycetaceae bacterium]
MNAIMDATTTWATDEGEWVVVGPDDAPDPVERDEDTPDVLTNTIEKG